MQRVRRLGPHGHGAAEIGGGRRKVVAQAHRDPLLAPVRGIFAAQEIKPQARVLATDRGIACAVVDYDALRGLDSTEDRLF